MSGALIQGQHMATTQCGHKDRCFREKGKGTLLLRGGLPVTLTQDNVKKARPVCRQLSGDTQGGLAFWSLHLTQSQSSHLYSCDLSQGSEGKRMEFTPLKQLELKD